MILSGTLLPFTICTKAPTLITTSINSILHHLKILQRLPNRPLLLFRTLRLSCSLRFRSGRRIAEVHQTSCALRLWPIVILSLNNPTLSLNLRNIQIADLSPKLLQHIQFDFLIAGLSPAVVRSIFPIFSSTSIYY